MRGRVWVAFSFNCNIRFNRAQFKFEHDVVHVEGKLLKARWRRAVYISNMSSYSQGEIWWNDQRMPGGYVNLGKFASVG